MVSGARSGFSSGRRMSSGRGFSVASASGPSSVPPPLSVGSGQFTPSPPTVAGMIGCFRTSSFLAGASTGPKAEDVVNLQEAGGNFFDSTLREVWINGNHRSMHPSNEAQRVCQSPDPTLWRERALTWMRRDYWEGLCNIWSVERWRETSTTMKVYRAANPQANKHTSGSVSFATHQSRLEKELNGLRHFKRCLIRHIRKRGRISTFETEPERLRSRIANR
ncbi:hypothetical protein Taro_056022 [Colocasia esculenta]|uniref:Uncharacterized protein n=1 Tax=Colocasia esculenta TaxID=4460 RepID=A0A843XV34_COLES|nr:hypothetical protein [Colocasia esculenta]